MRNTPGGHRPPNGHDHPGDPHAEFPIIDTIRDHSDAPRRFRIELHSGPLGYSLIATEESAGRYGYTFRAFDSNSPYNALGKIRKSMRRELATRHLGSSEPGSGMTMLHDRLVGHIDSSSDGSAVFVVDGIPLTLEDIDRLASTHEGFRFSLRFAEDCDEPL